ncbi:hypothetical protein BWI97_18305 [Siphonobacter sp. BAB-5405]|uniref:hypothetical protein n=1 Tax=Siphonobacter sp. BAB-5405 TaxID=1864825 RepID=UPI000C7FA015|nr:hypothetical protein [Siphonobacter sp. BAB-5405]PMD93545.1 hypothetical protein BWI97_18305 [Siphonobacter sp. BAB-5405]
MSQALTTTVSVRVSPDRKSSLLREAQALGTSLSELILARLEDYQQITERVAVLEENLHNLQWQSGQEKTTFQQALEKAQELAGQNQEKARQEAARKAVEEYKAQHNSQGSESDRVQQLKARLAQYETSELQGLFAQVKGHELDLRVGGQIREVTIQDMPEVVLGLIQAFQVQHS